jgi:hypothetical protein
MHKLSALVAISILWICLVFGVSADSPRLDVDAPLDNKCVDELPK